MAKFFLVFLENKVEGVAETTLLLESFETDFLVKLSLVVLKKTLIFVNFYEETFNSIKKIEISDLSLKFALATPFLTFLYQTSPALRSTHPRCH